MSRVLRVLGVTLVGCGVTLGGLMAEGAVFTDDDPAPTPKAAQSKGSSKKKGRGRRPTNKAEPSDAPEARPAAPAPTPSDGALKFSRDIAPILVANCGGCHNARQLRGKLDLSTFDAIMKGTPGDKVVVPGKPEESHLVLRIKGEETPKMPQGANRSLSDEAIAKIEQWVKAGAVLDAGNDPKAPLEKYAASPEDLRKAGLAKLSPEDRDKKVEEVGRERWKKANPKSHPEVTSGAHFLLFGTLSKDRAGAALRSVESQYAPLKSLVGPAPLEWGEKASLYVFNDLASFVEFARVIENRELEPGTTSLANFSVASPYIAVVDPLGGHDELATPAPRKGARGKRDDAAGAEERTLAGLLVEQLTVGAVSKAGKAPQWVALGLGAQAASRVEPRSRYLTGLRRTAFELYNQGWVAKANEALGGETKTEDIRAVGFAVLESVAAGARGAYPSFVRGMFTGGEKLDDVLGQTLGIDRAGFLQASGQFVGSRYGR